MTAASARSEQSSEGEEYGPPSNETSTTGTPRTVYSDNSASDEEESGGQVEQSEPASTRTFREASREPTEEEREFWVSCYKDGVLEHRLKPRGQ